MTPRLAVLIPVFNGQTALDRTLQSLACDSTSFDIVVVDDGSHTPITVPEAIGPHRVILRRLDRNQGIEAALNEGLRFILPAGYEYVARLDAADKSLPGRLAAQLTFLDMHPDHALVATAAEAIDATGRPLYVFRAPSDHDGVLRFLRYNNCIIHPSVMMRVSALKEVGLYGTRYPAAEDYDLFYRLADRYRVAVLPQVFVQFEVESGGISASKRTAQLRSRVRIQWDHFDRRDPHAYLGLLVSAAMFVTPQRALNLAKRVLWR